MNKNKEIINILEFNYDLLKFGIHYPLSKENVRESILLFLESSYRYLKEINGVVTKELYENYLQKIIAFNIYGNVKDFHKDNCYQLFLEKKKELPWYLCKLMKFDSVDDEYLIMMTLQKIIYSNVTTDIINFYERELKDES